MKRKGVLVWLKFIISLVTSGVIGLVGSMLVPQLKEPAEALAASLAPNPLYEPMTIYILLALVPLLLSMVSGYLMALAFKPRAGR